MDKILEFIKKYFKQDLLELKSGMKVRVFEKDMTPFEGIILAIKHGKGANATFTVRKVTAGVGVEKIYPLYSPSIQKIDILGTAKTRRAKIYFVRHISDREIRRKLKPIATK